MVVIERSPGQGVRIGPYTLRVVAVHPDGVVIALRGPEEDGEPRGPAPAPGESHGRAGPGELSPAEPLLA